MHYEKAISASITMMSNVIGHVGRTINSVGSTPSKAGISIQSKPTMVPSLYGQSNWPIASSDNKMCLTFDWLLCLSVCNSMGPSFDPFLFDRTCRRLVEKAKNDNGHVCSGCARRAGAQSVWYNAYATHTQHTYHLLKYYGAFWKGGRRCGRC